MGDSEKLSKIRLHLDIAENSEVKENIYRSILYVRSELRVMAKKSIVQLDEYSELNGRLESAEQRFEFQYYSTVLGLERTIEKMEQDGYHHYDNFVEAYERLKGLKDNFIGDDDDFLISDDAEARLEYWWKKTDSWKNTGALRSLGDKPHIMDWIGNTLTFFKLCTYQKFKPDWVGDPRLNFTFSGKVFNLGVFWSRSEEDIPDLLTPDQFEYFVGMLFEVCRLFKEHQPEPDQYLFMKERMAKGD